ncbi:MAG: YaiO family outer membrane beta-barrel protein [Bradymonadaceae bacterium]
MMIPRFLIMLMAVFFILLPALAKASIDCEMAREYRVSGELDKAEETARECITLNPYHIDAYAELSRALGLKGHHADAVNWIDLAIAGEPTIGEYHLWRARLLYWQGRNEDARRALDELPRTGVDAGEIGQFRRTLDKNTRRDRWRSKRRRPSLKSEMAHLSSPQKPAGWHTRHTLAASPMDNLVTEYRIEGTRRTYGAEDLNDITLGADGQYLIRERYVLRTGGAMTPGAHFSPLWRAYIKPGYKFTPDLEVNVGYQHVQFHDGGVDLLNPQMLWYFGSFLIDARYYLGRESDGRIAHALMARFAVFPRDLMQIYVGASVGNQSDYLESKHRAPERALVGFIGAELPITRSLDLVMDYNHRRERLENEAFQLHRIRGGLRLHF